MREVAAGRGAVPVDEAFVAVQKDAAAIFVALENEPLFFGLFDAVAQEILEAHASAFGHGFDLALLQAGGGVAAAVGAGQAVGFLLDSFGNSFEFSLDEGMPFEVHAEAQIFIALLFAKTFDLDQVVDERTFAHTSIMEYS